MSEQAMEEQTGAEEKPGDNDMESQWDTQLKEIKNKGFSKKLRKQEKKWQKSLVSWKVVNFLVFRVEIYQNNGKK